MKFSQLTQRIDGNRKHIGDAGDLLLSMVSRKVLRQIRTQQGRGTVDAEHLEQYLAERNIFVKEVRLEGPWWRHTTGRLLAFMREDDRPVILQPGFASYSFVHPTTRQKYSITSANGNSRMLKDEAYSLTEPLPTGRMTLMDLGRFAWHSLSKADMAYIALACISVVLLTMFTPYVTKQIFSEVVPSGQARQLLPIAILLISATLGLVMLQVTRSLVIFRVKDKTEYLLQTSLMTRMLHLPSRFFRQWSAGDMSTRVLTLSHFSSLLTENMLTTLLTTLFTGILFIQFFIYGGPMMLIGIGALTIYLFFIMLNYYYVKCVQDNITEPRSKMYGLLYEIFSGIQKIRTNGAEERAYKKWAEIFTQCEPNSAYQPLMYNYSSSMAFVMRMVPMIITMWAAWSYRLSLSDYIAYCAVLGIAMETITQLETIMKQIGRLWPHIMLCQPILDAALEDCQGFRFVKHLEGAISINDLSFRYNDNDPWIFSHLNIHINPGEYVAIIGPSGCGKSTLMRLLLGLEEPQGGDIYYDKYNLKEVNRSALRRHSLGTLLQDARLMEGSILDNILYNAPDMTEDDAWRAAKLVALDDDIKMMPNGMKTHITEDGRGVSGGQLQRILLARTLVRQPDVLLLDEATSALDNTTQEHVIEQLAQMNCTRIVIAQRLETIQKCDRIINLSEWG